MSRVVIDINSVVSYFVRGWVSGIGRTTMGLVQAMQYIDSSPIDIHLYSQNMKGIGGNNLKTSFPSHHLYLPYRKKYNQLLSYTPLREWSTGYDLYHIPHNFDYVRHPEKTIVTLHDAFFLTHPDDTEEHAFAREYYTKLAKRCRGIITCSESSKRDIMEQIGIPEDKIDITPWGYNEDLFHPIEADNPANPFFLSVSCSLGRKNTMSVIKAYELFSKSASQHDLILVWPNVSREVNSYIVQHHLENRVHILTQVSDEQLVKLYNQATATFFLSRYEGFGFPILESMACGTPVVTCSNSSLPEVGGDAALYVDPDDIEGVARNMTQFENNAFDYERLSSQCLAQANRFSWKECARQTVAIYQKYL